MCVCVCVCACVHACACVSVCVCIIIVLSLAPFSVRVSSSISLNASIFASVCLASRLPTAFHAFVIVSLAVLIFVLFPDFRTKCKVQCIYTQFVLHL